MRDQFGLVPPGIKSNYDRAEMVDRQMDAAFALHKALVALDSRLDLVFITDRADPEYGVTPGRWHVTRKNDPPAADSYMAITTPDGAYREPDSGVLIELGKRDLWRNPLPLTQRKPSAHEAPPVDDGRVEELAHDLRAGARLPGDNGLTGRWWGRGRVKGIVGS
jgi:hypothetical protein